MATCDVMEISVGVVIRESTVFSPLYLHLLKRVVVFLLSPKDTENKMDKINVVVKIKIKIIFKIMSEGAKGKNANE